MKKIKRNPNIDLTKLPRCLKCLQYPKNCDCDKKVKNANSLHK
jgi:hypothetical protein